MDVTEGKSWGLLMVAQLQSVTTWASCSAAHRGRNTWQRRPAHATETGRGKDHIAPFPGLPSEGSTTSRPSEHGPLGNPGPKLKQILSERDLHVLTS